MADLDLSTHSRAFAAASTRVVRPAAAERLLSARERSRRDLVNIALWTLQGWIAMFYIGAGYAKISQPMALLELLMRWPGLLDPVWVRLSGGLDLLLGVAVLAPLVSWRDGLPLLVGATTAMLVFQAVAVAFHGLGGELGLTLVNVALLLITIPVAVIRSRGGANPVGRYRPSVL